MICTAPPQSLRRGSFTSAMNRKIISTGTGRIRSFDVSLRTPPRFWMENSGFERSG